MVIIVSSFNNDFKYYKRFMRITKKGLILDLGCGIGKISDYLTKCGYDCIGYDNVIETIALGKETYPHLNLKVADIIDIPKLDKKANGAIYMYSLSNLSNEEIFSSLASCNKNLVNNGKIMIAVLCKKNPSIIYPPYVNAVKKDVLIDALNKAGYRIYYCKYGSRMKDVLYVIATKYKNI